MGLGSGAPIPSVTFVSPVPIYALYEYVLLMFGGCPLQEHHTIRIESSETGSYSIGEIIILRTTNTSNATTTTNNNNDNNNNNNTNSNSHHPYY